MERTGSILGVRSFALSMMFALGLLGSAALLYAAPGDTVGDCWRPAPGGNVAVAFANSPNNPIDCALPANACKTAGNCDVWPTGWARWKPTPISIGDCSKPNKTGACQYCPNNLTCAIGDLYLNSNDCINQMNKQAGNAIFAQAKVGGGFCK